MKGHNAFTLIELLVVIAIIGMLATIILVSLQSARNKALDTQTLSSFKSINQALELYYDTYGYYPHGSSYELNTLSGGGWSQLQTMLAPYMSVPSPNFVSKTGSGGVLIAGYDYFHAAPHVGIKIPIFSGGVPADCVIVYDGYYLTALLPAGATGVTANDGGPDTDAIDPLGVQAGRVDVASYSSCGGSTSSTFSY